jgi:hypothetical protein|tara:strand:+ start:399 stop:800 length:402 start_codon:yes stop_codon:yes gene_type:complete
MAQFLKVPFTSAAGVLGETLIPVNKIGGITATSAGAGAAGLTTIVVSTDSSATSLYTIVLPAPIVAPATAATRIADALAVFSAALVANPGGIVSTVVPPLTTAQNPLPQTGSGRQPIVSQAVRSRFRSAIFTA